MRDIILLNGVWEYKLDLEKCGIAEKWFEKAELGDSTWARILIPNSINCIDPKILSTSTEEIWFWRFITLSKESEDRRIELCFDRIYPYAEIYLDKKIIYSHNKGLIPVSINIPKGIPIEKPIPLMIRLFGFEEQNKEGLPLSSIYSWYGIFGNVYYKLTGPLQFKNYRIQAYPKDNYTKAHIDCHFDVNSLFNTDIYAQIALRVLLKGKEVFSKLENFKTVKDTTNHVIISFQIDSPELWSPQNPIQYDLDARLSRTNQFQDNFITQFGIREIIFRDSQLLINGKAEKLFGVQYDGKDPIFGPTQNDSIIFQDLSQMKQMGLNFIHSETILPDAVLFWANQLGILIIESLSQKSYFEILKKDCSNPSVIGFSIEDGMIMENIGMEFGTNLILFNKMTSLDKFNESTSSPRIMQFTDDKNLTKIIPIKAPRIIHVHFESQIKSFSQDLLFNFSQTDECNVKVIEQIITLYQQKDELSGIILGDWTDSSPLQVGKKPSGGLLSNTRQPKPVFYTIYYLLKKNNIKNK